MEQLISRGQAATASNDGVLITALEAENIIQQLQAFNIEQIGSEKWLQQHNWIQKLNLQAHHNAQTYSDEFVMESLVSLDKLGVIVKELLSIEIWKAQVYPLINKHLSKEVNSITTYTLLYQEAAVANLLEIVLYHATAAESLEEDYLLEMCDWCQRKLHYLNTTAHEHKEQKERDMQTLVNMDDVQELQEKSKEISFGVGMCCLNILRSITSHLSSLPCSILRRIVNTLDIAMTLIPLLEKPPWIRTYKGKVQKYVDNQWQRMEAGDRLKLAQHEAQIWLTLTCILLDSNCRAQFQWTDFHREQVLKLGKFMNELLIDQLPVLKEMQRLIDQLNMNMDPNASLNQHSNLMLEQVPMIREQMLVGKDWQKIGEHQIENQFSQQATDSYSKARLDDLVKSFEFLAQVTPDENDENKNTPQADYKKIQVRAKRKVGAGMWEQCCEFEMQIDGSRDSKPIEVKKEGQLIAKGEQKHLNKIEIYSTSPLPADGQVCFTYGGKSVDAIIKLPGANVRDETGLAKSVWATIGVLAVDGIVLQIKLKRGDKKGVRDKRSGVWDVYYPVEGVLTTKTS